MMEQTERRAFFFVRDPQLVKKSMKLHAAEGAPSLNAISNMKSGEDVSSILLVVVLR